MKIQYASEFRVGKILWDGREKFITKVVNENEKMDIIHIDGKLYSSQILKNLGVVMVEIGAVPEHILKIKREKIRNAEDRLFKNSQFRQKYPCEVVSIQQILDWKDEDGEGFKDDDFVLRTMEGNGSIVIYEDDDFVEREMVNELKTDYALIEDINYLEVRPITFGSWKKLSDKRKLSSKLDKVEKKVKVKKQIDIIGKHD